MDQTIWIACDHGGYLLKKEIMKYLEEQAVPFHDCGTDSEEIVRYPYYANAVASAVSQGRIARGILLCSTGVGMSIAANKYPHVRASLCTSPTIAHLTRAHNDSNILCLGGKITGVMEALAILKEWLHTDYEGGRHDISLGLLKESEKVLCSGRSWEPKLAPEDGKKELQCEKDR